MTYKISDTRRNFISVCSVIDWSFFVLTTGQETWAIQQHRHSLLQETLIEILPFTLTHGSLHSSVDIATRYRATFWRSNPSGSEIFHVVQTGSDVHSALCAMDTVSFPEIKRPERGTNNLPPFRAEVVTGLELHLHLCPVLAETCL